MTHDEELRAIVHLYSPVEAGAEHEDELLLLAENTRASMLLAVPTR
jgi:hypothetical protein